MGSVVIKDVYKAYGQVEVIKGISLDINDGEFITLVGPSGCGKSTLLRMISGLEDISYGDIAINDRVVNNVQPKDRDIAMVFQSYALYPHMTVAENMGFAMQLKKIDKVKIKAAVQEAADILGLTPLLKRYPKQLSGGQRQRVAMGRAIVRKPQVFLFDEPLSNLDAKLRVQMRGEIKQLHRRLGITTVYVTHDQIEAMTLADRIVVMNKGVVEQVGSPRELFDYPCNRFVANFIGSPAMNFVEGELVKEEEKAFFITGNGSKLPLKDGENLTAYAEVLYGIRPEHLRLSKDDGVKAEVIITEDTGSEIVVLAKCCGEKITVLLRERVELAPGDIISLEPVPGASHFFDAKTQKRIFR